MTAVWISIAAVAIINMFIKAAGPAIVGGRELPSRMTAVIALLAPALLAGLVITETFGDGHSLVFDERSIGVFAAGLALLLRAPVLVAVVIGAVTTATIRLFL